MGVIIKNLHRAAIHTLFRNQIGISTPITTTTFIDIRETKK